VSAALGLQVVDEAVFALAEKQPGLRSFLLPGAGVLNRGMRFIRLACRKWLRRWKNLKRNSTTARRARYSLPGDGDGEQVRDGVRADGATNEYGEYAQRYTRGSWRRCADYRKSQPRVCGQRRTRT